MKSSLDFLFNHAKIDYSEIVTMLKNEDLTWLKLLFGTEYSNEDQHQGCHIISVILTVCFYCTHPANVTVDPSNKTEAWILGVQENAVSDKGTIQAEEGTFLQTFQENSF